MTLADAVFTAARQVDVVPVINTMTDVWDFLDRMAATPETPVTSDVINAAAIVIQSALRPARELPFYFIPALLNQCRAYQRQSSGDSLWF